MVIYFLSYDSIVEIAKDEGVPLKMRKWKTFKTVSILR